MESEQNSSLLCSIHEKPFAFFCGDCMEPLCVDCKSQCGNHKVYSVEELLKDEMQLEESSIFALSEEEKAIITKRGKRVIEALETKINNYDIKKKEATEAGLEMYNIKQKKTENRLKLIKYVLSHMDNQYNLKNNSECLALFMALFRCNVAPRIATSEKSFNAFYGASLVPFVRDADSICRDDSYKIVSCDKFDISMSTETGMDVTGLEGLTSCLSCTGHLLCFDSNKRTLIIVKLLDKEKGSAVDTPATVAVVGGFASYTLIGTKDGRVYTVTLGEKTLRVADIHTVIEAYADGRDPLEVFTVYDLTKFVIGDVSENDLECASSAGKSDLCQYNGTLLYRAKSGVLVCVKVLGACGGGAVSEDEGEAEKFEVSVHKLPHSFNWVVNSTGIVNNAAYVTYYDDKKRCGILSPINKEIFGDDSSKEEEEKEFSSPKCACQMINKDLFVLGGGALWTPTENDMNKILVQLSPLSSYHPLIRVWRDIFLSYNSAKGRWVCTLIHSKE